MIAAVIYIYIYIYIYPGLKQNSCYQFVMNIWFGSKVGLQKESDLLSGIDLQFGPRSMCLD